MEKLLLLEVKLFAHAFQWLMFEKPFPPRLNSSLSWFAYQRLGLAMQRHSRLKATA